MLGVLEGEEYFKNRNRERFYSNQLELEGKRRGTQEGCWDKEGSAYYQFTQDEENKQFTCETNYTPSRSPLQA